MKPEVALYKPQIPQNTGNIARMTVGFDTTLHLIGELGFELTDKYLKRAALDYWKDVQLVLHKDFDLFYNYMESNGKKIVCFSKRGSKNLREMKIENNTVLLFGQEQHGMDWDLLKKYDIETVYIKVLGPIRSHNLSNTVAMGLYEAYSQNNLI